MPVTQAVRKPKRTAPAKAPQNRVPPLALALALTVLLGGYILLPAVRANTRLVWSFGGATAALLIFLFFLRRQVINTGRKLHYEFQARGQCITCRW